MQFGHLYAKNDFIYDVFGIQMPKQKVMYSVLRSLVIIK